MKGDLAKGIAMILLSALLACLGQLAWKLSAQEGPLFLLAGFALYGVGALLMILAMRHGELSVLHPMMSMGYVLSVVLGFWVLGETVTLTKVLGIGVITLGLVLISLPERGRTP